MYHLFHNFLPSFIYKLSTCMFAVIWHLWTRMCILRDIFSSTLYNRLGMYRLMLRSHKWIPEAITDPLSGGSYLTGSLEWRYILSFNETQNSSFLWHCCQGQQRKMDFVIVSSWKCKYHMWIFMVCFVFLYITAPPIYLWFIYPHSYALLHSRGNFMISQPISVM